MAYVLQITDGTTTVDLLSGYLELRPGGFSVQTGRDSLWETFDLMSAATAANQRTAKASLDKLFDQARKYMEQPLNNNPVWLYWQSEGESAKRSLILDGESEILAGEGFISPLLAVTFSRLKVAVRRRNFWEITSATAISTSGLAAFGGTWAIGNDAGNVNQRISKLAIDYAAGDSADRIWVGIKPTRNGTAGFISKWECESGTNVTDAADTGDATASGSSKVRVSYATVATLAKRFTLFWSQIQTSANWDDLIGEYLVLARIKVDAGTTEVVVQLRDGWGEATEQAIVGTQYVSGETDWAVIELGRVMIPPTGNRDGRASTADAVKHYRMEIWSERISVAGTLDVDCLILIPAEHMFYGDKVSVSTLTGELLLYTGPDDLQFALQTASGGVLQNVRQSFIEWEYPIGAGLLVLCYDLTTGGSVMTMTVDVSGELMPRYESYRV